MLHSWLTGPQFPDVLRRHHLQQVDQPTQAISSWLVTTARTEHVELVSRPLHREVKASDIKFTFGQHDGLSYHEVLHKYPGYYLWGK